MVILIMQPIRRSTVLTFLKSTRSLPFAGLIPSATLYSLMGHPVSHILSTLLSLPIACMAGFLRCMSASISEGFGISVDNEPRCRILHFSAFHEAYRLILYQRVSGPRTSSAACRSKSTRSERGIRGGRAAIGGTAGKGSQVFSLVLRIRACLYTKSFKICFLIVEL